MVAILSVATDFRHQKMDQMFQAIFHAHRFEDGLPLGGTGQQRAGNQVGQLIRRIHFDQLVQRVLHGMGDRRLGFVRLVKLRQVLHQLRLDGAGLLEPFHHQFTHLEQQRIHDDAVHRSGRQGVDAVNPVRLVAHGPTQFVPGSHYSGRRPPTQDNPTFEGREAVPVFCKAGDIYLTNHQCWHRGAPNVSDRTRYVLQLQYATRWADRRFRGVA